MAITAEMVKAALEARHDEMNGWLCFREVTEPDTSRRVDFLALQQYRSRGLELHGFEVKVTRQDWLNELKDASKAEAFARHCERWWLVAPASVVEDVDEVPPGWGYMQYYPAKDDMAPKLVIRRRAPRQKNTAIDRRLVISLMRATEKYYRRPMDKALEEAKEEGRLYGYDQGMNAAKSQLQSYNERVLEQKVKKFEEATGIDISGEYFNWKSLGEAVKLLIEARRKNKHEWLIKDLRERAEAALKCAELLEKVE